MGKTVIKSKEQAREALYAGVKKLADAVITTMGPAGRLVLIDKPGQTPHLTKDGVTVAKNVQLSDPTENLGAKMVRQAAEKVVAQAGDGTTSVTRLASHLIDLGMQGIRLGINPVGIKKGMTLAATDAVEAISELSVQIDSDHLKDVATISANGDVSIGTTIAEAMKEVGADGVVVLEESRNGLTTYEMVEGMEFARGYASPYFSTNDGKMIAVLEKAKILLVNHTLGELSEEFLGLLDHVAKAGIPLVIIAEGFSEKVLSTLVLNKHRGTLKVCAVKAPEYGDRRTHVMHDIAIVTGGTVLDKTKNITFKNFDMSFLGSAEKVTVSRDTTIIIDGAGKQEDIEQRLVDLKAQYDNAISAYDQEHLQQRISKIVGGVAVINVGGINETDMKERKDRFEDALSATQAALQEGIVPGGGVAYMKTVGNLNIPSNITKSEEYGYKMVKDSMSIFFKTILSNAGYSDEEITLGMINIKPQGADWKGLDIETKKVINYKDKGIIDPAKVVRCVIETGVAVAGNILLVECTMVDELNTQEEHDL
jgi:chaperonin GroEL